MQCEMYMRHEDPMIALNGENYHRKSLISNFEKYTPRQSLEYQMFLAEHPELKD